MKLPILIAMVLYMAMVIWIGVIYSKKTKTSEDYFLGGRGLGPWVTAMSAEASDMSSWLLMGLPGLAYATGFSQAGWTAIGLILGTYLNWKIVAKRLRHYTEVADNAITVPDFFSNRFKDDKKILSSISAIMILIFFTVYTASGFAACGTLLNSVFGLNYQKSMIVCAIVIVLYTSMGGFLAASTTDLIQGLLMSFAIVIVLIVGVVNAGGVANVIAHGQAMEGFFDVMKYHDPATGGAVSQGVIPILSGLAWGLGYMGMPHILIRYISIKSEKEMKKSRIVGTCWTGIILVMASVVGMVGLKYLGGGLTDNSQVFIRLVRGVFPALVAGILLSAILAASMSTADSQLLASSSAFSSDVYKPIFRKSASDKEMLWAGRIVVIIISVVALAIAMNPDCEGIMALVSNAWGAFGSAFGPVIVLSLYWKRLNYNGALASIIVGFAVDMLWYKFLATPTGLYEIVPGFAAAFITAIVVSLLTKKPDDKVVEIFEKAKLPTE